MSALIRPRTRPELRVVLAGDLLGDGVALVAGEHFAQPGCLGAGGKDGPVIGGRDFLVGVRRRQAGERARHLCVNVGHR